MRSTASSGWAKMVDAALDVFDSALQQIEGGGEFEVIGRAEIVGTTRRAPSKLENPAPMSSPMRPAKIAGKLRRSSASRRWGQRHVPGRHQSWLDFNGVEPLALSDAFSDVPLWVGHLVGHAAMIHARSTRCPHTDGGSIINPATRPSWKCLHQSNTTPRRVCRREARVWSIQPLRATHVPAIDSQRMVLRVVQGKGRLSGDMTT